MAVLCVDFGSTFTKASWIDVDDQELRATVAFPTTIGTDVLDGLAQCQAELRRQGCPVSDAEVMACSSAGGGLRIAVIGNEELVTSEAGRRMSLSSGGHVVAVVSGGLGEDDLAAVRTARPDLLLLVGGTNGGNATTLLAAARVIGRAGLGLPVVVAGNIDAAAEVSELLGQVPHVIADNVVPEIGVFAPDSARNRVREMFLTHVIGGKGLSRSADFAQMVVGPTPDIVLRGLQSAAETLGQDVVVVDVGGATTDVHSVVRLDGPQAERDDGLAREVVAPAPATRTVEGDLGMRWSAAGTIAAGRQEDLLSPDVLVPLEAWAARPDTERLPQTVEELSADASLARTAIAAAVRRHAGRSEVVLLAGQRVVRRTGIDIREAGLVIGSGGVLRADPARGAALVNAGLRLAAGPGRMLPTAPQVTVDRDGRLASIGLLAPNRPALATVLAQTLR